MRGRLMPLRVFPTCNWRQQDYSILDDAESRQFREADCRRAGVTLYFLLGTESEHWRWRREEFLITSSAPAATAHVDYIYAIVNLPLRYQMMTYAPHIAARAIGDFVIEADRAANI